MSVEQGSFERHRNQYDMETMRTTFNERRIGLTFALNAARNGLSDSVYDPCR